ncbi:N(4)-(Beta-N-acetylglucosaminyl)-L-asparaginase [Erpetoichthys calabaricus]|uniref:Zgc:153169 n=1 Tax=Erpetoichthys calabaricus TaxID=27687 RepID=A0A8C4TCH5_ERPCA|nr:N(4)-(Beta-N-acetylglucosaminyl)-L-asparaginase [Erpetoichthys calabaricus]
MAAIGTWAFSYPVVKKMKLHLLQQKPATDCVEESLAEVEDNLETGKYIVGRGGYPNRDGQVQCDAAIMEGRPGRFGAVAALSCIGTPVSVARQIMEKSNHSMLVGEGALAFAKDQGFKVEDNKRMLSSESATAYQDFMEKKKECKGHDTLGLIALDLDGNIAVGVSSSGIPFKSSGRVGDSPLPGCGLYADSRVGAAAATGDGDKIMCFCPSFHVVHLMKQGVCPADACQAVLNDIQERIGTKDMFEIGLIAMNIKGDVGAASSVEFPYAFWHNGREDVQLHTQLPI